MSMGQADGSCMAARQSLGVHHSCHARPAEACVGKFQCCDHMASLLPRVPARLIVAAVISLVQECVMHQCTPRAGLQGLTRTHTITASLQTFGTCVAKLCAVSRPSHKSRAAHVRLADARCLQGALAWQAMRSALYSCACNTVAHWWNHFPSRRGRLLHEKGCRQTTDGLVGRRKKKHQLQAERRLLLPCYVQRPTKQEPADAPAASPVWVTAGSHRGSDGCVSDWVHLRLLAPELASESA